MLNTGVVTWHECRECLEGLETATVCRTVKCDVPFPVYIFQHCKLGPSPTAAFARMLREFLFMLSIKPLPQTHLPAFCECDLCDQNLRFGFRLELSWLLGYRAAPGCKTMTLHSLPAMYVSPIWRLCVHQCFATLFLLLVNAYREYSLATIGVCGTSQQLLTASFPNPSTTHSTPSRFVLSMRSKHRPQIQCPVNTPYSIVHSGRRLR